MTLIDIPSLIARIEAATGPDRELDAEIALAVGVVPKDAFRPCASIDPGTFGTGAYSFWKAPRFTGSVDAAMTLIPEEWGWTLHSDGSGEIYKNVPANMAPGAPGSTVISFEGNTASLSLCAAALRARLG
jgi:hypothetical protein